MYNSVLFEWDSEKNRLNQKKHAGIDFETASRIFADPNLMLRKDRVIDGEQRWHAIGRVRKAVLLVVYRCGRMCIWRRRQMAKNLSASSRRGKQIHAKPIRQTAESIWNKPLTERQKAALEGVARRQKRGDVSKIDYSDIPPLTEKQLAQFRRPPKKLVAVRLDADVFEWLRRYGAGYSTRINHVLRLVMSQDR
jgi:uncharacterized DUF497 family protein/uncharacterized protein (DUF4415 family)